jgi:trk system potassium uptake protein
MRFCIIGLGTFGTHLTRQLSREGHEIVAVDNDPAHINQLKDEIEYLIQADCTNLNAFHEIPIDACDAVILAIGEDFEASLSIAANVQQLGAKRIISRIINPLHGRLLKLLKIDQIVAPARMVGKTLQEAAIRDKYELNLITIAKSRGTTSSAATSHSIQKVLGVPLPDRCFEADDILVLFGKAQDIRRMMHNEGK